MKLKTKMLGIGLSCSLVLSVAVRPAFAGDCTAQYINQTKSLKNLSMGLGIPALATIPTVLPAIGLGVAAICQIVSYQDKSKALQLLGEVSTQSSGGLLLNQLYQDVQGYSTTSTLTIESLAQMIRTANSTGYLCAGPDLYGYSDLVNAITSGAMPTQLGFNFTGKFEHPVKQAPSVSYEVQLQQACNVAQSGALVRDNVAQEKLGEEAKSQVQNPSGDQKPVK